MGVREEPRPGGEVERRLHADHAVERSSSRNGSRVASALTARAPAASRADRRRPAAASSVMFTAVSEDGDDDARDLRDPAPRGRCRRRARHRPSGGLPRAARRAAGRQRAPLRIGAVSLPQPEVEPAGREGKEEVVPEAVVDSRRWRPPGPERTERVPEFATEQDRTRDSEVLRAAGPRRAWSARGGERRRPPRVAELDLRADAQHRAGVQPRRQRHERERRADEERDRQHDLAAASRSRARSAPASRAPTTSAGSRRSAAAGCRGSAARRSR